MNKTITAARLLCLATVFFAPVANAQANESAATVQQLMVRSGMSTQLRGLTDQIVAEIRQHSGNLDARVVAVLVDAAKHAFRPDVLHEDISVRVGKKMTVADMKAALAWLESDVGRRVTRAEELAATADQKRIGEFAEGLKAKPQPAKRQNALADLITATAAVRTAIAVAETMALGVALGMDSLQPREQRAGEAVLLGRIRQAMPEDKMQAFFGQYLPVAFGYTYRGISEEDLARYTAFLKSPAGKRYQDAMSAAFIEGLARSSRQMGEFAAQRQRQAKL